MSVLTLKSNKNNKLNKKSKAKDMLNALRQLCVTYLKVTSPNTYLTTITKIKTPNTLGLLQT